MIVQIRGTSGSGKSTVMRQVMTAWGTWQPVMAEGRKKPLYYRCGWNPPAVVLGHYESPCGGCDTVGSAAAVHDLIADIKRERPEADQPHVLSEGLLLSEDVKWTTVMAEWEEVRCVFLTTPLHTCLEQIKSRRAEAGKEKPVNPLNTTNRVATIERARVKLLAAGVKCVRLHPRQAAPTIVGWLRSLGGSSDAEGGSADV